MHCVLHAGYLFFFRFDIILAICLSARDASESFCNLSSSEIEGTTSPPLLFLQIKHCTAGLLGSLKPKKPINLALKNNYFSSSGNA